MSRLTGAQALIRTLLDAGVNTCFTNPGTSEMHFVAALDGMPEMRAVLTLFEGVATGAADGYARMAGKPAATLLHLGCGLGNGMANLHNARRGRTPVVNIVGEHATTHLAFDAPLQSDIETVARNVSSFVRTAKSAKDLGRDTAEAVAAALGPPGNVATLIVPADVSWSTGAEPCAPLPATAAQPAAPEAIEAAADALRQHGKATTILLGGRALREPALLAAVRIAAATGARLLAETFPARMERGAGLPAPERIAYLAELATVQLAGLDRLILVDAKAPVSFFAYPGKKSQLAPQDCQIVELVSPAEDAVGTLERLADLLHAPDTADKFLQPPARPDLPEGELTADKVCQAIGALLPENAIISDEAQTSGVKLPASTAGAPPHDLLTLTGGAIGQGLPVAVGAALACPQRKVFALAGDGSAMYTLQALWTMARERLDVIAIVFCNRSYAILNMELERTGAGQAGPAALAQLNLTAPTLDFAALGDGMGVPSVRASDCASFIAALQNAIAHPGPHLIEAVVPSAFDGWKLKALPHALNALQFLPNSVARAVQRRIAS